VVAIVAVCGRNSPVGTVFTGRVSRGRPIVVEGDRAAPPQLPSTMGCASGAPALSVEPVKCGEQ
jgi:hypothetical protein